ncbi:DUF924 family protein [Gilvimarinus chinensis]|uniref:DUF924 family protein n=1 Tax=Gilvimarinus chinensis TaxID=396005 RepID=UPI00035FEBFC|nr:DUF924 family protein [Gilvimarinus chinensis]
MKTLEQVLHFWFSELQPTDWFKKSEQLDRRIRQQFLSLHQSLAKEAGPQGDETPKSLLAKVIVLDQFSRNMFRDTAQAFAYDQQALALAQYAVNNRWDDSLTQDERSFLYMPYMHSEDRVIHQQAMELFTRLGNANNLKFERKHKEIIDRFGRYPHRNQVLGRESTAEEEAFLQQPRSSF